MCVDCCTAADIQKPDWPLFLEMIARLRLRSTGRCSARQARNCDTPGFLLNYTDPSSVRCFGIPNHFLELRKSCNIYFGLQKVSLVFVAMQGPTNMVFMKGVLLIPKDQNDCWRFHDDENNVWDVLQSQYEGKNQYLLEFSKTANMPTKLPLLPLEEGNQIQWEYAQIITDPEACRSSARAVREWLGLLAVSNCICMAFITKMVNLLQNVNEFPPNGILGVSDLVPSLDIAPQTHSHLFWVYYVSPKPFCLHLFLRSMLSISVWSPQMNFQLEALSARHEGFYRCAFIRCENGYKISFDDATTDSYDVHIVPGVGRFKRRAKVYYRQPAFLHSCFDDTHFRGSESSALEEDIPLYLLPGSVPVSEIMKFGVIRSEIDQSWSSGWHKKFEGISTDGDNVLRALQNDALCNLRDIARF